MITTRHTGSAPAGLVVSSSSINFLHLVWPSVVRRSAESITSTLLGRVVEPSTASNGWARPTCARLASLHVDGSAVRSCVTPLSSIKPGQRVVTLTMRIRGSCWPWPRCCGGDQGRCPFDARSDGPSFCHAVGELRSGRRWKVSAHRRDRIRCSAPSDSKLKLLGTKPDLTPVGKFHRGAGRAVRLLHQWHDHGSRRLSGQAQAADRG